MLLEIEGLVVRYGPFLALDGVDMNVDRGEIVGIIGSNGAGKSSVVRTVIGLVKPASGRIRFGGRPLNGAAPQACTRLGISLTPEGRGLFPRMSVEENLMMGGYPLSGRQQMSANVARSYELFPILRERRQQYAGTLSGGQQQMLAIAMGLMSDPKLLILDEPSLGLAPIVIGEIRAALQSLKTAGMTVLLVEQNAALTASVADRIYVLQAGRVRYHDTPQRLFEKPEVVESFLSI